MAWPTGQQYGEAVQHPHLCFGDADLKACQIETDRLGLPRPRSGNFAVVYKGTRGQRTWAIKCFTREIANQRERYAAISSHLRNAALPFTVGFEFVDQGVRASGSWYPVLKMEWVSGVPLSRYIETHLRDETSLLQLAAQWVRMIKELRAARIAHGDLQHGNVILSGDSLKLVDYDGMFVPALSGAVSTEVGHPNYQHPGRERLQFGPRLDNFSGWTVYVSLVALAVDPSLWQRSNAGDDCLLFRAGDFAAPSASVVFKTLRESADDRLRSLADVFAGLLTIEPHLVPPVDEPILSTVAAIPSKSQLPSWLDDHIGKAGSAVRQTAATTGTTEDASWVLDFLSAVQPPPDAHFMADDKSTRIVGLLALPVAAALALLLSWPLLTLVLALGLVASGSAIARGYSRQPGVKSSRSARQELAAIRAEGKSAQREVKVRERARASRNSDKDRALGRIGDRLATVDQQAARARDSVGRRLAEACRATSRRKVQADSDEQATLAKAARDTGARVATLRSQVAKIQQEEQSEVGGRLAALQQAFVQQRMRAARIVGARIPGVGPHLTTVLQSAGMVTASDVDRLRLRRLPGFGPTRANAVLGWVRVVETQARAAMPQALPQADSQAIWAKFASQRSVLMNNLVPAEAQLRTKEAAVRSQFAQVRAECERLEAGPRATAANELKGIQAALDRERGAIRQEREAVIEQAQSALRELQMAVDEAQRAEAAIRRRSSTVTSRVRAYGGLTLPHYVWHLAVSQSGRQA